MLIVAACSGSQPSQPLLPEQNTRIVYPAMPPTKCARKPEAPPVDADDTAWARYKRADSDAGDDCRDKLDEVDRVRETWGK